MSTAFTAATASSGATFRLPLGAGHVFLSKGWARPVYLAVYVLSWPARVIEGRRTLAALSYMSGRELADIGLTRSDLREVADNVALGNATHVLSLRAAERSEKALG